MNIDGRTPLSNLGVGSKTQGSEVQFHELLGLEAGSNLEPYTIITLIAHLTL